ncbi:sensor histidine kinase [Pedosphaera parvula]|uniref:histidine kinase n=1 Tax=Pedosphaera parvula (strain Ellin514) TaxID=320771 RepID=B9XQQ8_PEDPL|nr:ATP-binding protein [Pedosphaera parvula]EEF57840.1 PAS/PAC sensor signal transduction histidine kinase [Pedosphaera parvula Ellin514]
MITRHQPKGTNRRLKGGKQMSGQIEKALPADRSNATPSGELFRAVLESMDRGFCIIELLFDEHGRPNDFRYLEANSAFETQTGLKAAVGKRVRELVPQLEQHWFDLYGRVAETGAPIRYVNEVSQLNHRWFEVNAFRLGRPEERKVGVIVTDITVRRKSEAALRESEHRLHLVFDNAPLLIGYMDANWVYRFGNGAYAEWFGRDPTNVPVRELLGEALFRHRESFLRRALEGEWLQFDGSFYRSGFGLRDAEITFIPDKTKNGETRGVFVFASDVTELKRAEQTMRQMRDELANINTELEQRVEERTTKLRDTIGELEHFSYSITHDMRAPLRAMRSFAQFLWEEYNDRLDVVGRDYLHRIGESAARMDNLITDALNYSKVVRGEFPLEPVDPDALLRGIIDSYPQFHIPQAEIYIKGTLPLVIGNKAALTQVFSNLLSNGVKFVDPDKIPRVRVWAEPRGEWVRLWFKDSGIGINPDQQQRIFVMFEGLSQKYEGTGIGLAIVQKLVERIKGRVGFESESGKGSRFWVELRKAT